MDFLTSSEVGRVLSVSRDTVRAMLDRGELSGFRCGRVVRLRRDSVERLVGGPIDRDILNHTDNTSAVPA